MKLDDDARVADAFRAESHQYSHERFAQFRSSCAKLRRQHPVIEQLTTRRLGPTVQTQLVHRARRDRLVSWLRLVRFSCPGVACAGQPAIAVQPTLHQVSTRSRYRYWQ